MSPWQAMRHTPPVPPTPRAMLTPGLDSQSSKQEVLGFLNGTPIGS